MRTLIFLLVCAVFLIIIGSDMNKRETNRLAKEKSPYLLQHKDNPVWWFAFGEEAFKAAKENNKPIFLSIGYSTCHWCHVMEHESFENEEVANLLNQSFISIKVDREERPDVDKIYMDAVVAMTGRGGWPLTAFLTPDLKPFFGGTYFPREQFMQLLQQISHTWKEAPQKVTQGGEDLANFLKQSQKPAEAPEPLDEKILSLALEQLSQNFDSTYGGFGHPPKFPGSMNLMLLLRIALRSGNKEALTMVTKTLDAMAYGGIYDHLGGGFARYSTDEKWLVPHFEKMLYDNALLSWTYLEAYQFTKNEPYKNVSLETLNYIVRDMTHPEGGFYSAEDADSEGVEGKFYVWSYEELKNILSPKEFETFTHFYDITQSGNFEHNTNILSIQKGKNWKGKEGELQNIHEKLFQYRKKRIHPHKDDKILTAWNGLMIASMAKAAQVLENPKFLEAAQKSALFIQKNLWIPGKKLLRRYRDGEAKFNAYLDDYAFLIHGLLNLYEADFDLQWITWAEELQETQNKLLWDEENQGYFFTEVNSPDLIRRSKDYQDGAKPNSNAMSVLNLLKLYHLTFKKPYYEKAQGILKTVSGQVKKYPTAYSQMLIALDYYLSHTKEIVVVGQKEDTQTKALISFLRREFLPNKVIAFISPTDSVKLPLTANKKMLKEKTTVYVCEDNTCLLPTSDMKTVQEQVKDFKKWQPSNDPKVENLMN